MTKKPTTPTTPQRVRICEHGNPQESCPRCAALLAEAIECSGMIRQWRLNREAAARTPPVPPPLRPARFPSADGASGDSVGSDAS